MKWSVILWGPDAEIPSQDRTDWQRKSYMVHDKNKCCADSRSLQPAVQKLASAEIMLRLNKF